MIILSIFWDDHPGHVPVKNAIKPPILCRENHATRTPEALVSVWSFLGDKIGPIKWEKTKLPTARFAWLFFGLDSMLQLEF